MCQNLTLVRQGNNVSMLDLKKDGKIKASFLGPTDYPSKQVKFLLL
jgi:hypothetical protein